MKTRIAFQALGAFAVLAASAAGATAQAGAAGHGAVAAPVGGGDVGGQSLAEGLIGEVATMRGTITDIDAGTHEITLRESDGTVRELPVNKDVTSFKDFAVGQTVNVSVLQPIGLGIQSAGDGSGKFSTKAVNIAPAGRPKIMNVTVRETTATVVAVDDATRTLMLKGASGNPWSVKIAPKVSGLTNVQPGDRVTVQYTEPMVVGVTN